MYLTLALGYVAVLSGELEGADWEVRGLQGWMAGAWYLDGERTEKLGWLRRVEAAEDAGAEEVKRRWGGRQ